MARCLEWVYGAALMQMMKSNVADRVVDELYAGRRMACLTESAWLALEYSRLAIKRVSHVLCSLGSLPGSGLFYWALL